MRGQLSDALVVMGRDQWKRLQIDLVMPRCAMQISGASLEPTRLYEQFPVSGKNTGKSGILRFHSWAHSRDSPIPSGFPRLE